MDKQPNSRMCFVCGLENPIGLKLAFYQDGNGKVVARFTPRDEHQGYPGVLHGGITATLLDETLGRVANSYNVWMTTAKLEIRYRKPVPLGEELTVIGEMVQMRGRTMIARGVVRLADGTAAVEAEGLYVRVPDEVIEQMKPVAGIVTVADDEGPTCP